MDLDLAHDEVEEEEEEKKQLAGLHNFHVLAVDDSNLDRKLLERLLTLSSYQVTCVDSGDKALEYLGLADIHEENDQYDQRSSSSNSPNSAHQEQIISKVNLIMTDYSMPGITGYDLLKKIKDSTNWKDIPVVVRSSENVPSRINMCLEGGAEEFLLKPVKLSDLRKLHSHLTTHPNCHHDHTTAVDHMNPICCNINDQTTIMRTKQDMNIDHDHPLFMCNVFGSIPNC